MKAIILGAGRIGRGFISSLLYLNKVDVVFFEYTKELVNEINNRKEYIIHVLGHEDLNANIKNAKAYHIDDIKNLEKEWLEADFIFTAVGGNNMSTIGASLGEAYKLVSKVNPNKVMNIITCENWIDPSIALKDAILNVLDESEKDKFLKNNGVTESVVMTTGTGAPNLDEVTNPLDTWIQNNPYLPIDKDRIIGSLPDWTGFEFISGFGNLLKQKLYTNNTSVALIAFLGKLNGFEYVAESANDPEIEKILDQCYDEINNALVKGMGINRESQLTFSKKAKAKYQDREIIDILSRIARDPIRKLSPTDRLIGPAKIALDSGVKPKAISMAIAAALYYEDPNDKMAVKLGEMREEKGVDYILENICKLHINEPLVSLIKESIDDLKKKNWIKE